MPWQRDHSCRQPCAFRYLEDNKLTVPLFVLVMLWPRMLQSKDSQRRLGFWRFFAKLDIVERFRLPARRTAFSAEIPLLESAPVSEKRVGLNRSPGRQGYGR